MGAQRPFLPPSEWSGGVPQTQLGPRDRLYTLPIGDPGPTVGPHVASWMMANLIQPSGDRAGEPFVPTRWQIEFLLWWYAFEEDPLHPGQFRFRYRRGMRMQSKGSGKAIDLDERVPTPSGWCRYGDLSVGDYVFGSDGHPTRIIQVHPLYQGPSYRVKFSDGASVDVSAEHLWAVREFDGHKRVTRVLTTRALRAKGLLFPRPSSVSSKCQRDGVARFALPDPGVLDLPTRSLPLDPYVLGVWLGDGEVGSGRISFHPDDEAHLRAAFNRAGFPLGKSDGQRATAKGLKAALRALGVLSSKRIPTQYLWAAPNQRRALVAGFLDTDGYVGWNGQAEFCQVRPGLAEDMAFLLRSLGVRTSVRESDAKLYGRVVSKRYRLVFKPYAHQRLFTLPRKAARVRPMKRAPLSRVITAIESVPPKPMRCITVEAEDGVFLVGERMIPTHNSPFNAALVLAELCGPVRPALLDPEAPFGVVAKQEPAPLIHVAATSERQTATTMRMLRLFAAKNTKVRDKYGLDVGKTYVDTPLGGRVEQVASSAGSLEGFELSFCVAEETEHWLPSIGGPSVMQTLLRNTGKTRYGRVLETCNAPGPGDDSVAEQTYEDWVAQEEGTKRSETKVLFDAKIAPSNTALWDPDGTEEWDPTNLPLTRALEYLYSDSPWVSLSKIRENIWDKSIPESVSRRFYLNQMVTTEDAWCTKREWDAIRDRKRHLQDGEDIVMFFDGSKSGDATALVACSMRDGFVAPLGIWYPRRVDGGKGGQVDVDAVDAKIRRVAKKFNVVAFFADVREWESFVHNSWPKVFQDSILVPASKDGTNLIAWDMRSHAMQFAVAAERTLAEIREKDFRHSGSAKLTEHVLNARVHEYRGHFTVRKASPKSPRKIDAAVCLIGARMCYNIVKESAIWQSRNSGAEDWGIF